MGTSPSAVMVATGGGAIGDGGGRTTSAGDGGVDVIPVRGRRSTRGGRTTSAGDGGAAIGDGGGRTTSAGDGGVDVVPVRGRRSTRGGRVVGRAGRGGGKTELVKRRCLRSSVVIQNQTLEDEHGSDGVNPSNPDVATACDDEDDNALNAENASPSHPENDEPADGEDDTPTDPPIDPHCDEIANKEDDNPSHRDDDGRREEANNNIDPASGDYVFRVSQVLRKLRKHAEGKKKKKHDEGSNLPPVSPNISKVKRPTKDHVIDKGVKRQKKGQGAEAFTIVPPSAVVESSNTLSKPLRTSREKKAVHQTRVKKALGRVKTSPKVMKRVAGNSKKAGGSVKFKTKSRPCKLVEMIKNFSPNQIKAVKEIGFGGLLCMELSKTPTEMCQWLLDCFDPGSCIFSIDGLGKFSVSEYDVYDVFCLPLNPGNDVEDVSRCANKDNPDFPLKMQWREYFGLENNAQIPCEMIEDFIPKLTDGGDDFKQLFVMHAFATFLSPTHNRTIDLRLVKAVNDVNLIPTLNWSKFVLDRLCEAVVTWREGVNYFTGCIALLRIIYFHHVKFKSVPLPTSFPLIQHWTDKKVSDRIKGEKSAKTFGCGILISDTYPLSEKLGFVNGEAVGVKVNDVHVDDVVEECAPLYEEAHINHSFDDLGKIEFIIPLGTKSNDEIHSSAGDVVYAFVLLFQRDIGIVSKHYMSLIERAIEERRRSSINVHAEDVSTSPVLSQTQKFSSDPKVLCVVDELTSLVSWVTKIPEMLNEIATIPSNYGVTRPSGGVVVDDFVNGVCSKVVDDVSKNYVDVDDVEAVDSAFMLEGLFGRFLFNGKAKCSIDLDSGGSKEKVVFVSHMMRTQGQNMRISLHLFWKLLIIVSSMTFVCEPLVSFAENYIIPREDFYSLGEPSEDTFQSIMDCFSMLLNENQKYRKNGPRKYFFGVSQCSAIMKVFISPSETLTQEVDCLHQCWSDWMNIPCNDVNLENVELIFVPILFVNPQHFFLFVVNLKSEKVQWIDNLHYSDEDIKNIVKLSEVLVDNLATFLDEKIMKAGVMSIWKMESVSIDWKIVRPNRDCAVYAIASMLLFEGSDEFNCPLLRTAANRHVLRVQIAAALVLCDMNVERTRVLGELPNFKGKRRQLAKDVAERRKCRIR